MDTVEFQADIRDGSIEIPLEFRERFTDHVTVILVAESAATAEPTLIDELLAAPLALPGFRPLTRDEAHAR